MVDPLMTMDRYHEVKRDPDLAFRVMKSDVDALMAYAVLSFSHFADATLTPAPKRPTLGVTSSFPDLVRRNHSRSSAVAALTISVIRSPIPK